MNELLSGVVYDFIFIENETIHLSLFLYTVNSYAGIDTNPELKYPKGAGRVSFDNYNSYINAINSRFVHVKSADMDKRVRFYLYISISHWLVFLQRTRKVICSRVQMEVKPYVLDDQMCDD